MKKVILSLFTLLIFFPNALQAQEKESILIGNVTIQIGMEKDEVIKNLSKNYNVVRFDSNIIPSNKEKWDIYNKSTNRTPSDVVGTVDFQNNKVVYAHKIWGVSHGKEVASFGKKLSDALETLVKKDKIKFSVRIRKETHSGVNLKTIDLISDKHRITINVSDGGANIQEVIHK
jgi:hypothetical protein